MPKEQIISTILGVVIIVAIGSLIYRYLRRGQEGNIHPAGQQKEELQKKEAEEEGHQLPVLYKVRKGDHLWKIAEKFYQSGYTWVDIAKANNLHNPNLIFVNQELKIPNIGEKVSTVTIQNKVDKEKTSNSDKNQYTVNRGDWLSKIALRAYGDMFAWNKIYKANREIIGPNPNLIKPGQVLIIPN